MGYGKELAPHLRYGKEVAPHLRYGKELSQYFRYGKEATDDLAGMLKALGEKEDQEKADGIEQNEYNGNDEMILKNLLLQDLIKTEEEQKIFEILKFLKELNHKAATVKGASQVKLDEP